MRATETTLTITEGRIALCGPDSTEARPGRVMELPALHLLTAAEQSVLSAHPIPASAGLGAVIGSVLSRLGERGTGEATPEQRVRLAAIVRGLLSAVAAERVEEESCPVTRHDRTVVRAMQLIYAQLDDAQLSSSRLAGQLNISVRTLQAAFSASGVPVRQVIAGLRRELRQDAS